VTSQTTAFFVVNDLKTSDLTYLMDLSSNKISGPDDRPQELGDGRQGEGSPNGCWLHRPRDLFLLSHRRFTGNSPGILLSNECSFPFCAFCSLVILTHCSVTADIYVGHGL
jgi:hypothetical protein